MLQKCPMWQKTFKEAYVFVERKLDKISEENELYSGDLDNLKSNLNYLFRTHDGLSDRQMPTF